MSGDRCLLERAIGIEPTYAAWEAIGTGMKLTKAGEARAATVDNPDEDGAS
jgi:hypothetical protein